jgi:hypothetical protein
MAQGKVKVIEIKKLIEGFFVTAIASICVGIAAALLIVNCISPICKYSKPNYKCVNNIIEPDKCQKIEGGTNTINLNQGY